jgi:class 3 adenylate cyclase
VLFADLVSFTDHTTKVSPGELISELNLVFSRFDGLVEACGAEKIKTMGDGYLAVAGAPTPRPDHAEVICDVALRMREAMAAINTELGTEFQLRIGVATGPLIAGVVGTNRFSYDLWGETVNLASRMETMCPPGAIQVTGEVARSAGDGFEFDRQQTIEVKGIGETATCLLNGRRSVTPRSP